MRIAFATSQSDTGSTVVGRVLPLAQELAKQHEVHVLVLEPCAQKTHNPLIMHIVGREPFTRHPNGKKRLRGAALILNMLSTAVRTCSALRKIRPNVVVIVKPLPAQTLGVRLYCLLHSCRVLLDVDDFELTANQLSSLTARAVVHWSQRQAAGLASVITAATPFLVDHFTWLAPGKPVHLLPTGYSPTFSDAHSSHDGSKTILYIGSISFGSGHRVDMLPDIMKKIAEQDPTVRLLIAGDGDSVTRLRQLFEKNHTAQLVQWHGRFNPSEIPALVMQAAVVLDPVAASVTERAKSSFRVAAATAYGRAVVTSNVGIRPYLLPASLHHRLFAKPGDSKDYARVILDVLQHPLSTDDQTTIRTHADQYTWEKLARQFNQYLLA